MGLQIPNGARILVSQLFFRFYISPGGPDKNPGNFTFLEAYLRLQKSEKNGVFLRSL